MFQQSAQTKVLKSAGFVNQLLWGAIKNGKKHRFLLLLFLLLFVWKKNAKFDFF